MQKNCSNVRYIKLLQQTLETQVITYNFGLTNYDKNDALPLIYNSNILIKTLNF